MARDFTGETREMKAKSIKQQHTERTEKESANLKICFLSDLLFIT